MDLVYFLLFLLPLLIKNKLFTSKSNEKMKIGTSYLISIVGFLTAMQSIVKIIYSAIMHIYHLVV